MLHTNIFFKCTPGKRERYTGGRTKKVNVGNAKLLLPTIAKSNKRFE